MGVNTGDEDDFMLKTDTIQITPELLVLIAEVDEFKGAWRALGTLAPERLRALRHVAAIESIGSSTRIEGSKLTDREVERLLANLEIKKFSTRDEQEVAGYAYVPYSSLESVIENSKEGYYLGLRQTQGTIQTEAPNWQPWLMFLMRALGQQKRRLAEKVDREKLMMAALPELAAQIIDEARKRGRITMGEMIRATGASRNTLKEHFKRLGEQGHLVRHGTGKATWYALP
jgi:Fic family protein